MGAQDGVSGIAREILADARAATDASHAPDAEQLELLQAPVTLGGALGAGIRAKADEYQRARGGGRPPGARNLTTRDMLAFLRARGLDPMAERFRWAMHTPETLAAELGCTRVEAFDRLEAMWRDLTRYFYAPLAPVDDKGKAVVPSLVMHVGGSQAMPAGVPAWFSDPEVRRTIEHEREALKVEQDQRVSETAAPVSHADMSQTPENG